MKNLKSILKVIREYKKSIKPVKKDYKWFNEQLNLEVNYWKDLLEECSKEEILKLAEKMNIFTHHDNGRQRSLKQIKSNIIWDKEILYREGLKKQMH